MTDSMHRHDAVYFTETEMAVLTDFYLETDNLVASSVIWTFRLQHKHPEIEGLDSLVTKHAFVPIQGSIPNKYGFYKGYTLNTAHPQIKDLVDAMELL
jgi:hypothetical protein